MPEHICRKCKQPIRTWYFFNYEGHPQSQKVYTCGACVVKDLVEKYHRTGIIEHVLMTEKAQIGQWPDLVLAIKELRANTASLLLDLQKATGQMMSELLFDKYGEYRHIGYPLSGRFTNFTGLAIVKFAYVTESEAHYISFCVSECDPTKPWDLLEFSGSELGILEMLSAIQTALFEGTLDFLWVLPED